jgi:hypothetical protein
MVDEVVYPVETLPDPMDVVWSYFPYDETRGVPAIEPHPALVFQVNEYRPGLYSVKVVYGTSNVGRGDRSQHLVISNYNELMFAGLHKETFFDLGRFKWLPWTSKWFRSPDEAKYSTPVIGHLSDKGQGILRYILQQRQLAKLAVP